MNITPRIFNVILTTLVLGTLLWIGFQSNTAQEVPAESAAIQAEQPDTPGFGADAEMHSNDESVDEEERDIAGTPMTGTPESGENMITPLFGDFPDEVIVPFGGVETRIAVAAPMNVRTSSELPLTIGVSWSVPFLADIVIDSYLVEWSNDGGATWTEGATTTETAATITVAEAGNYLVRVTSLANEESETHINSEPVAISHPVTVEEPVPSNFIPNLLVGTFVIFLILVCYWLGQIIAKRSRLPEHGTKIFIVLIAFFGGFAAVVPYAFHPERIPLGIDLQGGVVLIYDVRPLPGSELQNLDEVMDELTIAIRRRIDPGGVRQISVTKLGTADQVEVVIPRAEDAEVDLIRRRVTESGALTFRIMANRAYEQQDGEIIRRGEAESGRDVRDSAGRVIARWVPIVDTERDSFVRDDRMVIRERGATLEALVKYNDNVNITGEYLTSVGRGADREGRPGVTFNFNSIGANKCRRLTSANLPDNIQPDRLNRPMGIILNDSLYSAPVIRAPIGANGIITFGRGDTPEQRQRLNRDIDELISVLQAGALPAELIGPAAEQRIAATLGVDTIQRAQYSLAAAAFITIVFMLVYYRTAGFIAAFCVITNTVLIVAIMLSLRAAFTLPGLAGLVLTIGMAIDANILIYERIREELRGGASLKMAIRNGYAKAFSAIFDSNITTIVIGCILYAIGTEQVKGFAVTLVLGIALNLFTAIFCARVIMDVLAQQKGMTTFKMMQLFQRPNINFLQTRFVCGGLSAALILIGLVAAFSRGSELFDIDFVGGVRVEAVFKEPQTSANIRERLRITNDGIQEAQHRLNDYAVQEVQMVDVPENTRFTITSSTPQVRVDGRRIEPDAYLQTVRNILRETFGDELEYWSLNYRIESTRQDVGFDEVTVQFNVFPEMSRESFVSEIEERIRQAVAKELIESAFSTPSITDVVRTVAGEEYSEAEQRPAEDWTVTFRAPLGDLETVLAFWKAEFDATPNFPSLTTIGGSVAWNTQVRGVTAMIAGLIFMAIYIAVRFTRWQYGLVAVVGLTHVVLVMLGLIAVSAWLVRIPGFESVLLINEFKIGLPVVAAFLAAIAYAINDTIILFDRVRENLGKSTILYGSMINAAINQVLSRTVLTSATTFFVAMVLYIFGGQGIHAFSFAIAVGIACGTYTTIFICAPLLFWMIGKDDLMGRDKMEIEEM